MRSLTDAQIAMKAAFRHSVKIAGGPSAAAEITRVDAARLSRYGNIECPEMPPIDVCYDIDKANDSPINLRALANLCDQDVTPKSAAPAKKDIAKATAAVAKAAGDLVSCVLEADADGVRTAQGSRNIDDKAARAEDTVVNLRDVNRPAMKTA